MIGKKIAEIRKRKGFTLSELAEKAQISKSYLSNLERNQNKNPSLKIISRVAEVLKIDPVTLMNPIEIHEQQLVFDQEWVDFVYELQEVGLEKERVKDYKELIEFIKWKNVNKKS